MTPFEERLYPLLVRRHLIERRANVAETGAWLSQTRDDTAPRQVASHWSGELRQISAKRLARRGIRG